ncbi:copper resistance protein CopC [Phenylobacterium sp. J426]|uniref:copper resistance protein CopC n=1 Tax=Phenylobacterium sp. J426 TaxID=2898439 RepID=UPI00215079DD|nr:copper resistance protein CopC [Phenylobacterium sp. J426]MCR5876912.1 copper resistance protein CopC [Phenylobacterium sp. J426]
MPSAAPRPPATVGQQPAGRYARERADNGAYKIVWSAASADGHKMTGEGAFKVG